MSQSRHMRRRLVLTTSTVALALAAASALPATAGAADPPAPTFTETYRPQFHFTPAQNWMNDPNGIVYYKGEYHLFFQYNPFGDTWGHMSWGHAVSTRPRALAAAAASRSRSSATRWSSRAARWWTRATRAASARPRTPRWWRSTPAADSTGQPGAGAGLQHRPRPDVDKRYAGNPVLDIGSGEFRDPKVFWYAPANKWVMAVAHVGRAQGRASTARRTSRTGRC